MEILQGSAFLFTVALLLALLIERVLEIVKSILDLLDSRFDWHEFWTRRADKIAKKLQQQLRMNADGDRKMYGHLIDKAAGMLIDEDAAKRTGVPVISGDAVRAFYMKIIIKAIGILFGLLIAYGLGLDIVNNWDKILNNDSYEVTWYGVFITGMVMGLGAAPVHKLITALERLQSVQAKRREIKK